MNPKTLAPLVGALLLATTASAQDDLPYYQEHRMVVIFSVSEDIVVRSWDGSRVTALQQGAYRFEANRKSQAILNAATLADGSGPFTRYTTTLSGQVSSLFGGAPVRDASFGLKITDANFNAANVVREGELTMSMRVQLGSNSSTTTRYVGPVARSSSWVRGSLDSYYSVQTGTINVWHAKLSLDDHLPIQKPAEFFPETINVKAHTAPAIDYDWGHEIEDRTWEFDLTRDALNPFGMLFYDTDARFPMVDESDYYGDYRSSPHQARVVIKESGDVWIQLSWGLTGRYHGWNYLYTATLSAAEFDQLRTQGSVTVSGDAGFGYGGEDYQLNLDTTCEFTFTATLAQPSAGTGLVGGVSTP